MARFDLRTIPVYPIVLSVSLTLNAVQFANRDRGDDETLDSAVAAVEMEQFGGAVAVEPTVVELPEVAAVPAVAEVAVVAPEVAVAPAAVEPTVEMPEGMRVAVAEITGAFSTSLIAALGEDADRVSQTAARLLAWELNFTRDLQRGDEFRVAYTTDGDDIVIHALTYDSQRFDRTFTAYRWQHNGDAVPTWFDADGIEVPRRLDGSPIEAYEQITSLLSDRPGHGGMDFAAAVGTPVTSPWPGRVTRTNWNWNSNGNCVEVDYGNGLIAKYLHLSENRVEAGATVSAGEIIALSGNTGHSTGPHLHYQLERNGAVVDPVVVHDTYRRSLTDIDRIAFSAYAARMNALLDAPMAL